MSTFLKNRNLSIAEERFGLLVVIDYHIIITLRRKKSQLLITYFVFWLLLPHLWLSQPTNSLHTLEREFQNAK